jgi:hypothetical protein
MCVVIIGLIGLAVDYGLWNETEATLTVAVNSAALNAVKTAAAADLKNDPKYIQDGQNEGDQWFAVSLGAGNRAARISNLNYSVIVKNPQNTNAITATATASATVQSIFGRLFQVGSYQVNVEAAASISTAPYLNIEVLLDNSSSMQIAASPLDIAAMLLLTPCSVPGNANGSAGTTYDGYTFNLPGSPYTYTPPAITGWPPIVLPGKPPLSLTPTGKTQGPICPNQKAANGNTVFAGTPCAFACHYDNSGTPAGTVKNSDLYALARGTIGPGKLACSAAQSLADLSNCAIELRFDVVKAAVKNVINAMITNNTSLNNLAVGIWDFNATLNRDFPGSGEASSDFAGAQSAVGGPPTTANGPDTGIKPDQHVTAGLHEDTDFNSAAALLAQTLTPAGNGTTQTAPRKVLFIVSDGAQDTNAHINAIDVSQCSKFKSMGYTVYVAYTPYYMSPHSAPLGDAAQVLNPNNTTSNPYPPVEQALYDCASAPADYIEADNLVTLTAALNTFLVSALNSPAVLTQ